MSRGLHLGVLVMCASRNGIPMAMPSGRFIERMGMCGEGKQQPIWEFSYKNVIGQSSTAETLLLIDAMDLPGWFLRKEGIFGIV